MKASFIDDGIKQDQAVRDAEVSCKCSAEILWYRIPRTSWKDDEVKAQIEQATSWFRKYCIVLSFRELKIDQKLEKKETKLKMTGLADDYHKVVDRIPAQQGKFAQQSDCVDAETLVEQIYSHLMTVEELTLKAAKKTAKPQEEITVLFLDEWFNNTSEGGQGLRRDRVTANSQTSLLIGMSRFDRTSQNMLTHELTHALRRQGNNDNKKCFDAFVKNNHVTNTQERGWEEHYSGNAAANQKAMTRPTRTDGTAAEHDLTKDRVLSIREYLTIVKAGYVKCEPGCEQEPKEGGQMKDP